MESLWLAAYLALACLAVVQSLLLGVQTWEHRRYARSCMGGLDRLRPGGHAVVFAPCKGLDVDLESNLRALLRQDYPDYEVVFIVESAADDACPLIGRLMAEHPHVPTRLVVAGRATDSGQKVHNLRAGTAGLSPQAGFLAFVDSDARPRAEWLRAMVGRLERPGVGAVTGYRWVIPVRTSIANHLLYSMNCGIMSLLGRNSHYLIWGGSWGIRREVFEAIGLHGAWQGKLSDDLVASRQLRRARLPVRFEPACVVASPADYTLGELCRFVRRQYLVGRFYAPGWWLFALAAATLSSLVWLGNLAALGTSLIWAVPTPWLPLSVCVLLYTSAAFRGWVRQGLVGLYFPERQAALARPGRFDIWAGPLVGLSNWLGVLGSLFGRQITWRGIAYRLDSAGRIDAQLRPDQSDRWVSSSEMASQSPDRQRQSPGVYRKAG